MSSAGDRSAVHLVESLRWDGRLHRADLHLDRMEASARRLDYPFDREEARRVLAGLVDGLEGERLRKVRVTLGPDGALAGEVVDVDPMTEPVPALLTDVRVDPADEALYHKTDRRAVYDRTRRRASQWGFREVLFRNTRGEVTEGSFTNLFVRSAGRWSTPPVWAGLLPGIYRRQLLRRLDEVGERTLDPTDLASADEVWLCNSVRGRKRARVTPTETI